LGAGSEGDERRLCGIRRFVGMRESIHELLELTVQIADRIDALNYDALQEYLVKREQILSRVIHAELTEEEKGGLRPDIQKILSYDGLLLGAMERLKDEIGIDIGKMSSAKKQKHTYGAVYNQDGMYFDRKK
jgi:hypothetical protein